MVGDSEGFIRFELRSGVIMDVVWNGFVCMEVKHGIRFSGFRQSNWIFYLLVKCGVLRFVSSSGCMISSNIGLP